MAEIYYNLGIRLCASIDKLTEKVGELIDIEKKRMNLQKSNDYPTRTPELEDRVKALEIKVDRLENDHQTPRVHYSYVGTSNYPRVVTNLDGTEEVLPVNAKLYPEGETRLPRNIHLSDPC